MNRNDAVSLLKGADNGNDILAALELIEQETQPVVSNDSNY